MSQTDQPDQRRYDHTALVNGRVSIVHHTDTGVYHLLYRSDDGSYVECCCLETQRLDSRVYDAARADLRGLRPCKSCLAAKARSSDSHDWYRTAVGQRWLG